MFSFNGNGESFSFVYTQTRNARKKKGKLDTILQNIHILRAYICVINPIQMHAYNSTECYRNYSQLE